MKKLLRGKQNFNANGKQRQTPAARNFSISISRNIRLKNQ